MPENESKFIFVSGQLSLDFINIRIGANDGPVDFFAEFSDLVAWLQQAGTLSSTDAKAALAAWGDRPEARRLLDRARDLRTALHEMAERLVAGKSAGQGALDEINRVLAQATGYNQLVRNPNGYALHFQPARSEAIQLLMPIALSAAELLRDCDPQRIRRCGNPVCNLYYYDTSKNRTRRWCSMAVCGNRMKAASFYRRGQKKKRRGIKS